MRVRVGGGVHARVGVGLEDKDVDGRRERARRGGRMGRGRTGWGEGGVGGYIHLRPRREGRGMWLA